MFILLYAPEFLQFYPTVYDCFVVLPVYCKSDADTKNLPNFLNHVYFPDTSIEFTSYDGRRFHLGYMCDSSYDIKYLLDESSMVHMSNALTSYNQAGIIAVNANITIPSLDVIQEILSGYITTQELSEITDLEEIRKKLTESKSYDICKLYLLMALPYLGNCDTDTIEGFIDDYNRTIQIIYYNNLSQYWSRLNVASQTNNIKRCRT